LRAVYTVVHVWYSQMNNDNEQRTTNNDQRITHNDQRTTIFMTHLETELHKIKQFAIEMMHIVQSQLSKSKEAFLTVNKDLAFEVLHTERRVNGYELLIDSECENLIALMNPVAIDLRFVLATLKINYQLERIADNAKSIAQNVVDVQPVWDKALLERLQLVRAFEMAQSMLEDVIESFENENTATARKVFEKDKNLDEITHRCIEIIAVYLKDSSQNIEQDLNLLLIHRKLERIGDLIKNIAEEIIFYIEAKILKHRGKSEMN
jgi:phosphate transport system protein